MADLGHGRRDRRSVPTSTYRLQLHAGFGFGAAEAVVPYLADLGVSHLYLSPVLQAAPGSMHGYDVVDHTRVSADLGGEAGLESLAQHAHRHGLGIVIDVVPNHMAIPTPASLNRPLWETLALGRDATTATWFDIDWDLCDGRVGLPVLGQPLDEVLRSGELSLGTEAGEPVVRYFEQRFPIAAGTAGGSVAEVLSRQHYLLADWRQKDEVLGYRRFFDVDTLIAVRVELPEVFIATHAVLLDLHGRGVVDGFRIDHPDGLTDPRAYLEMLAKATGGAWVVVEKVIEGDESLPPSWATAGTTGYDALRAVQTSLAPPTGGGLDAIWREVADGEDSLPATELAAKRQVLHELLRPELLRLVRRATTAAAHAGHDEAPADLEAALAAMLVHVEVYRAYLRLGEAPSDESVARLAAMHDQALRDRPDLAGTLATVRSLLLDTSTSCAAGRDLVVRFQQVCGPVMAKGVEDTTFYRWHRFIALNEVGGDPSALDAPSVEALHAWAAEQASRLPGGMTTLSTHDTKRGEDVRARLLAVGEDVDRWGTLWDAVRALAQVRGVDEPTAYLLMQTLIGAWPISGQRLHDYLEKATREAKRLTNWSDPDAGYEARVHDLADACLTPGPVAESVAELVTAQAEAVRATTLSSKLLQLTLPGVPDVYQGAETVTLSLVDPDNRRPVDFASRQGRLAQLDAGGERADLDDDKLWVTARALRLRRDHPELFGAEATYRPLTSTSPHLVGFVRGERVVTVVTRWPGRLAVDGWGGASLDLPDGSWVDLLAGHRFPGGRRVGYDDLLADLPVALLMREGE